MDSLSSVVPLLLLSFALFAGGLLALRFKEALIRAQQWTAKYNPAFAWVPSADERDMAIARCAVTVFAIALFVLAAYSLLFAALDALGVVKHTIIR
mgnify:CR=1 FL=1|jgi:hypothetical protein